MCGHPKETMQDHQDTLDMLKKLRRYVATGTIVSLEVNSTAINQDTPLAHWAFANDIKVNNDLLKGDERMWFNPHNPVLTLSERARRQVQIYEVANQNGWPLGYVQQKLNAIEVLLSSAKQNSYAYF
jgi:hypothetical protein